MKSHNQSYSSKKKNFAKYRFNYAGKEYIAKSAREIMLMIFRILQEEDPTFLQRFSDRKHGTKRRYLSRDKYELYPDRPDLAETASTELMEGWWLGTNYSKRDIQHIIELAMDVFGKDESRLQIYLE